MRRTARSATSRASSRNSSLRSTAARQLHGDPYAVVAHSLGGYAAQLAVLGPLRGTPCLVLIEALPDAASIAGVLAGVPGSAQDPGAAAPRPGQAGGPDRG